MSGASSLHATSIAAGSSRQAALSWAGAAVSSASTSPLRPPRRQRRRPEPRQPRLFSTASPLRDVPPTLREQMSQASSSLNTSAAAVTKDSASDQSRPSSSDLTTSITATVRRRRSHQKVHFLSLSDGSLPGAQTLQAVIKGDFRALFQRERLVHPGETVRLQGRFTRSKGAQQDVEFVATNGQVVGEIDAQSHHPIFSAEATTSMSVISRDLPHLRPLLREVQATLRLRSRLQSSMSTWFTDRDFCQVNPPIMTESDCEGAGEVFAVQDAEEAVLASEGKSRTKPPPPPLGYLTVSSQLHLEALTLGLGRTFTFTPAFRAESSATSRHLGEFWMCEAELLTDTAKGADGEMEEVMDVVEDLIKAAGAQAVGLGSSPSAAAHVDATYLNTAREDDWGAAIAVQHTSEKGATVVQETETATATEDSETDVEQVVVSEGSSSSYDDLCSQLSTETRWPRITYRAALGLMAEQHEKSPFTSTAPPTWGDGLPSVWEKWLAGSHFKSPVFVTDYPAESKPFYMRLSTEVEKDEAQSKASQPQAAVVAKCFDLLLPRIGEVAGGSLREDRIPQLVKRLREAASTRSPSTSSTTETTTSEDQLDPSHPLHWYVDSLRRYGLAPHGGFGIGVERLVAWLGNRASVKDCIPFPRVGKKIRF